jgi:hypothetical protein
MVVQGGQRGVFPHGRLHALSELDVDCTSTVGCCASSYLYEDRCKPRVLIFLYLSRGNVSEGLRVTDRVATALDGCFVDASRVVGFLKMLHVQEFQSVVIDDL